MNSENLKRKINNFLNEECSDLKLLKKKDEKKIIKGHVQMGKTNFMICSAIKYIYNYNMSSIIIVRNIKCDKTQIESRIKQKFLNLKEYLKKHNLDINIENILEDNNIKLSNLDNMLSGENPKIMVLLGNNSQVLKITKKIKRLQLFNEIKNKKINKYLFSLFIDEADIMDSGVCLRTNTINRLKEESANVFYISATILDIGLSEKIGIKNVYILNNVPNYMGISKIKHRELFYNCKPSNKNSDIIIKNDDNIVEFLDKFINFKPYYNEWFDCFHPRNCLVNIGNSVLSQQELFKYILNKYLNKITLILYNGNGIVLYNALLKDELYIEINGKKSKKCEWSIESHQFNSDISYSNVIQYLKNNGGVKYYGNILTISGKLANRGISFVSEDYGIFLHNFKKGLKTNWVGWRLTELYYVTSKNTTQPNLIQNVGRLCCIVVDSMPTYLYTTKNIFKDVRNAFWSQEELISRSRSLDSSENIYFRDILLEIKMNKNKLSKRSLTINNIKKIPKKNIVDGDDGGFNIQIYHKKMKSQINTEWDISSDKDNYYLLVLHNNLGRKSKEYYNRIIKYLSEYKCSWFSKAYVIEQICENKTETNIIHSTTWAWHNENNLRKKFKKTINTYDSGLLFKLKNNIWYIRYN